METPAVRKMALTEETVRAIEWILHRGNQVEVKVENGEIAVIEIRRKKRI